MSRNNKGRVCIVTGGSKGIGHGIALAFIEEGYDVLITGRDEKACIDCCSKLQNLIDMHKWDNRISYFSGDVSVKALCDEMIRICLERYGRLDVLICNAGIYPEASVENCSENDINETMRINYMGTVYSIQASIEPLKQSQAGRIIIISSITGPITGNIGFAHYGATKAAQVGYMRTAAIELAPYNITVNAILPGNILTESLGELGDAYTTRMIERIPMNRLGSPSDIGNASLFLASEGSSYITGNSITVDGGQVLPEA